MAVERERDLATRRMGLDPTSSVRFQLYFEGDPWVRSESPVSSIDDRATKGVLAQRL